MSTLEGVPYKRRPARSFVERFWAKADTSGGLWSCWPWQAAKTRGGYGHVGVPGQRGTIRAHRVAWQLTHGPIPAGLVVMHTCDNPPCINPAHLRLGTPGANSRDMVFKGRGRGQFEPGGRWDTSSGDLVYHRAAASRRVSGRAAVNPADQPTDPTSPRPTALRPLSGRTPGGAP